MSTADVYVPRMGIRLSDVLRAFRVSFRFSLRELLLFTMVIAAFAAWFGEVRKEQQPLVPTHIAEYFTNSLQQDLIATRTEIGEEGEAWSFAPSVMNLVGFYKPEHSLNREWFCDLHLPWAKAREFRDKLNGRVSSHIRQGKTGEHISTSEYEGGTEAFIPYFFADSTKYHCDDIHGTIRIYLARIDDQNIRVITLLSEHRVP